jgi:hypothetical protein
MGPVGAGDDERTRGIGDDARVRAAGHPEGRAIAGDAVMRVPFTTHTFAPASQARIDLCDEIVTAYHARGLRLTLRQLYYQLVSRNAIPNVARQYKNLSALISEARLAGLIDWEAIEDRLRHPVVPLEFESLQHRVDVAIANYRFPRWRGQSHYAELWCEKDALAGVLQPIADQFHVTLQVNRGYSSQSAMYVSARRIARAVDAGKRVRILYLGDHDPSGEDMVRDVRDRLATFGCPVAVLEEDAMGAGTVRVEKLALTRAQVAQYQLPPQPVKVTDARYSAYALEHGVGAWELDALPPDVLAGLVRAALADLVEPGPLRKVLAQERRDVTQLRKAVRSLNHQHRGGRTP